MHAAVINRKTSLVENAIVIDALEPSYGMQLAWLPEGFGIGDVWLSTDPETGVGTFSHPVE